jgi:ribose-phosphate pyrophosphokinase
LSADAAPQLAALPIKRIITTDSVPMSGEKLKVLGDRITVLSVSALLGEVIRRAHEGRSVGEMFNE